MRYWIKTSGLLQLLAVGLCSALATILFGSVELNLPTSVRGIQYVPTPLYMVFATFTPAFHGYLRLQLNFPESSNTHRIIKYFDPLVVLLFVWVTWLLIQTAQENIAIGNSYFLSFVELWCVSELALILKIKIAPFIGPAIFAGTQLISLDCRNWLFHFPKTSFENSYIFLFGLLAIVLLLEATLVAKRNFTERRIRSG